MAQTQKRCPSKGLRAARLPATNALWGPPSEFLGLPWLMAPTSTDPPQNQIHSRYPRLPDARSVPFYSRPCVPRTHCTGPTPDIGASEYTTARRRAAVSVPRDSDTR